MRVSETANLMAGNRLPHGRQAMPSLPNGSLPPKGHVNPYEDPDMDITGMSPSDWQKIVPVDDKVKEQLRDLVREDFVKRYGMSGSGSQADAQAAIIKDYVSTLSGKEKLYATFTCEQIARDEADRLSGIIRKELPDWQYGQAFDGSILDGKRGVDVRV